MFQSEKIWNDNDFNLIMRYMQAVEGKSKEVDEVFDNLRKEYDGQYRIYITEQAEDSCLNIKCKRKYRFLLNA